MNVSKFSNYLLAVLLGLQLLGYVLFFFLWKKFNLRGILLAVILVFIIDIITLYYLQQIKVTDKDGKKKSLGDVIGDVIGVAVWLGISAVVFTVIAMVIGYRLADKNHKKEVGLFIPILAIGTLYGALGFMTKVCDKN